MLADFTAGRELHPALKNAIYFYRSMLDPSYSIVKKIFEFFKFFKLSMFLRLITSNFLQIFAKHFMYSLIHKFGVTIDTKSL